MITYSDVRRALVQATAYQTGAYADVFMVAIALETLGHPDAVRDPDEGVFPIGVHNAVSVELGAMDDNGEATTQGFGLGRTARYDGVIVMLPDNRAYPLVDLELRAIVSTNPVEVSGLMTDGHLDLPEPTTDERKNT